MAVNFQMTDDFLQVPFSHPSHAHRQLLRHLWTMQACEGCSAEVEGYLRALLRDPATLHPAVTMLLQFPVSPSLPPPPPSPLSRSSSPSPRSQASLSRCASPLCRLPPR